MILGHAAALPVRASQKADFGSAFEPACALISSRPVSDAYRCRVRSNHRSTTCFSSIDVTLQPIIFLLMFTYIFGGAIAGGSQQQYLQFVLPSMMGIGIALAGVAIGQNLNADIEKGVFDRRASCSCSCCRSRSYRMPMCRLPRCPAVCSRWPMRTR